jgi:hypothetical protein
LPLTKGDFRHSENEVWIPHSQTTRIDVITEYEPVAHAVQCIPSI